MNERKRIAVYMEFEYEEAAGLSAFDMTDLLGAAWTELGEADNEIAIIREQATRRMEVTITVGNWPPDDADADDEPASVSFEAVSVRAEPESVPWAEYSNLVNASNEVRLRLAQEASDLRAQLARVTAERDAAVYHLQNSLTRGTFSSKDVAQNWLRKYSAGELNHENGYTG